MHILITIVIAAALVASFVAGTLYGRAAEAEAMALRDKLKAAARKAERTVGLYHGS